MVKKSKKFRLGKIHLNFTNRSGYTFLSIIILVLGAIAVSGGWVQGDHPVFHDEADIRVTIGDVELSLEEAIGGNPIGGGTDTRCDASGTCSQVCIGTDCQSSWPVVSISGTGNGYACFDEGGNLYRSETLCPLTCFTNVDGDINFASSCGGFDCDDNEAKVNSFSSWSYYGSNKDVNCDGSVDLFWSINSGSVAWFDGANDQFLSAVSCTDSSRQGNPGNCVGYYDSDANSPPTTCGTFWTAQICSWTGSSCVGGSGISFYRRCK